jgi:molybdenum cofactor cytidylyltransferase
MKFGSCPIDDADGGILAHSVRATARVLKKGRVLGADDIALLRATGLREVVVARLDADDVPEDAAASRIAQSLAGAGVRIGAAFTGRANLYATSDGLVDVDASLVNSLNGIDEAITIATLSEFSRVTTRQMLATVKIIPFAVPKSAIEEAEGMLRNKPAVSLSPFKPRQVALILTSLPGTRASLMDKTRAAIQARVRAVGSQIVFERQLEHATGALMPALRDAAREADLILVFGASAITDRRDVIPAAIESAGGKVVHFGMPVDPGNLLLLGKLGDADVVGLPGCARSPKLNGFDFVLWRLAAGLPVGRREIAGMGVGGLLGEIAVRPQPRDEPATEMPRAPKIAAIVLAAGASSRMTSNKLLAEIDGAPMVLRVAKAAAASASDKVVVVTGRDSDKVREALAGTEVTFVDNRDYRSGLSSSLKCGLGALEDDCDGAVILLGDMPDVTAQLVDKLIAAFDPVEGRAICVATRRGKRGNPALFARRFFPEMLTIEGDIGARGLLGSYPELVCEVEADDDAPLIDIDTPEALAAYRGTTR